MVASSHPLHFIIDQKFYKEVGRGGWAHRSHSGLTVSQNSVIEPLQKFLSLFSLWFLSIGPKFPESSLWKFILWVLVDIPDGPFEIWFVVWSNFRHITISSRYSSICSNAIVSKLFDGPFCNIHIFILCLRRPFLTRVRSHHPFLYCFSTSCPEFWWYRNLAKYSSSIYFSLSFLIAVVPPCI